MSFAPFHLIDIEDYKSIGRARVDLEPLTVLVGRNGSGKSNFLDALRFVSDSLSTSLDQAVKTRGAIPGLSRRGVAPPCFSVGFHIHLPNGETAIYVLVVNFRQGGEFLTAVESLEVQAPSGEILGNYVVGGGEVVSSSIPKPPPAHRDRLYLVNASGFPEFRPTYDAITAMKFYALKAEAMKTPRRPDVGEWLESDGGNIASVVARLNREQPATLRRITQYLGVIVPEIISLEPFSLGPVETLKFVQRSQGSDEPQEFFAWSMSDGTLLVLGALVAAAQTSGREEQVSLICIEEPENSLHPAAAGALMDGLREAAEHTQIIITSHSPDLVDQVHLDTEALLAVAYQGGSTRIAPIDKASLSVIREHLYSPGELLRMDQLEPDRDDIAEQNSSTLEEEA